MDHMDPNGRTREENERIVNRILDIKLWVGDKRKSIRKAGKRAVDRRSASGYDTINFIMDAMKEYGLDYFQNRMVFDELEWLFMCKQCNVGQEASQFISTNTFQIQVYENVISLESVGPCKDCMRH
ncbi:hypothetical protein ACHAPV_006992 [Trichoderma viride]